MKKMLRAQREDLYHMLGFKKKARVQEGGESVDETVHIASFSPVGIMGRVQDPVFIQDPVSSDGIEIGDTVALASTPGTPIGQMSGVTGFRDILVQQDNGAIVEYPRGSLVKCKISDSEIRDTSGALTEGRSDRNLGEANLPVGGTEKRVQAWIKNRLDADCKAYVKSWPRFPGSDQFWIVVDKGLTAEELKTLSKELDASVMRGITMIWQVQDMHGRKGPLMPRERVMDLVVRR